MVKKNNYPRQKCQATFMIYISSAWLLYVWLKAITLLSKTFTKRVTNFFGKLLCSVNEHLFIFPGAAAQLAWRRLLAGIMQMF